MAKKRTGEEIMRKFGLRKNWNAKDRNEVTDYHRGLLGKWKRDRGYAQNFPIEHIQGFLDYLEDMAILGYGFTDIGSTIGMTRERVRYYFKEYKLKRRPRLGKGSMYRTFDKEKEFFPPVSDSKMERLIRESMEKNKKGRIKEN